jgi:hypothetical protein
MVSLIEAEPCYGSVRPHRVEASELRFPGVHTRPASRRSNRLFDQNSLPRAFDAAGEFETDQSEPQSRAREPQDERAQLKGVLMTARHYVTNDASNLRRGLLYRATTAGGSTIGEYLGMEAPHGDLAILLRAEAGTHSIELTNVTSIEPIAA